jgi:diacylglycerol kinase (ATP)
MSSPFGKAVVMANPRAGKGKLARDPSAFERLLKEVGLEFEIRFTERRGHAMEMAREAIKTGCQYLVAVGGDGTINEVVNGMMGEEGPLNPSAVLGVVAAGSGCDFIRTFGLPGDTAGAIRHLGGENLYEIDLGRVTYSDNEEPRIRYFNNVASAGFSSDVARFAERLPRWFGRVRYLLAFWITLGSFSVTEGKVVMDRRTYEGRITDLVVANCQFFGGGMQIAPKANPADGRFDVLVQMGSKRDYIEGITKVFRGEHLPSLAIKEFYSRKVELVAEKPLRLELDGEVLGTTPASFEIMPGALRLKI